MFEPNNVLPISKAEGLSTEKADSDNIFFLFQTVTVCVQPAAICDETLDYDNSITSFLKGQ